MSYAKKMTGTYEEMLKNVQKNQEIKIGCMPVLAPYHFARLVADFRKEYPDIKLVIDERIASEIQENSDRYDFLILRENMMEDQKKFRFPHCMMINCVQCYMKNIRFMEEIDFN